MKVLQINTTVNTTSTGRITEEIGTNFIKQGHESLIAYCKAGPGGSQSKVIRIGNLLDNYVHVIKTRLFDQHGFGSKRATKKLVKQIEREDPDVIGLHNLHGYYLNIDILFNYLKKVQKPVVWTFHDCWPFTGHCAFFDYVNCEKWKKECSECPLTSKYPASWFLDQSKSNFHKKRDLFTGIQKLKIITPSNWLKNLVQQSFLNEYETVVIHNGINLDQFRPVDCESVRNKYGLENKKIILGVASVWDRRKGLIYGRELATKLGNTFKIVLVGLDKKQIAKLPKSVIGIKRTENVKELAALYSSADVFLNPTLVDNFPTTNLEALACGTPVITFDTGGSPESINEHTGIVVEKGNSSKLLKAIHNITSRDPEINRTICRQRAEKLYNKEERFHDYINVYKKAVTTNKLFY